MGSPETVIPILSSIERIALESDSEVVAVYTALDRKAGRGQKLLASPIKEYALARGLDVLTPIRLTNEEEEMRFAALGVDLVVLAAYGLLLPRPFLFGPGYGAINIHPSLLPRHRGASPVAGAILAGDATSGTTIMKMNEGLDTGDVLAIEEVSLGGTERTRNLTAELFALGARMLDYVLPAYLAGALTPRPQPSEGITVSNRFSKEDGWLNWQQPAVELERRIRALDPWPGTATMYRGERLEILSGLVEAAGGLKPGVVMVWGTEIAVGTGEGVLVLDKVQLAGRKPMTAIDFVRGRPDFIGATLPSG